MPEAWTIPAGTRVRIKDAGRSPVLSRYIGWVGVTEHPDEEGCYVVFSRDDVLAMKNYIYCFWDEMEVF